MEQNNKKVIVIFGGSGELGHLLFSQYDKEKYSVINISLHNKLRVDGVINIQADVTKKLGLLYIHYKLQSLVERIDVLVLASMFIYHKDLFSLTKKELMYEFDVNVFSQIECTKMILNTFWDFKETKDERTCFYISSAVSTGTTKRRDLQSYAIEKKSFNYVAEYLEPVLSKAHVNSLLYLPGSLGEATISNALVDQFWNDVLEKTKGGVQERFFI